MRQEPSSQSGFTLLEVLVVTVVVGVIAAIGIISLMGALDRSKQRATIADMRTISRSIEAYNVDTSHLPDDSGGLEALKDDMIPYATNVLPTLDHWGNAYEFESDGAGNYSLVSFGKDGQDGANLVYGSNFDYNGDIVVYNGIFVASTD